MEAWRREFRVATPQGETWNPGESSLRVNVTNAARDFLPDEFQHSGHQRLGRTRQHAESARFHGELGLRPDPHWSTAAGVPSTNRLPAGKAKEEFYDDPEMDLSNP